MYACADLFSSRKADSTCFSSCNHVVGLPQVLPISYGAPITVKSGQLDNADDGGKMVVMVVMVRLVYENGAKQKRKTIPKGNAVLITTLCKNPS